jgi:putative serine protease PepD
MTPVKGHPAAMAVPITFASQVADALRADGRVDHGWLGLAGRVTSKGGFLITALAEGGPSEKAGIRRGDTIVKADSMAIATIGELMATARRHWPGERIRLEVKRGRDDLVISVRLARMPRIEAPTTTTNPPAPSTTAAPSTPVSTRP